MRKAICVLLGAVSFTGLFSQPSQDASDSVTSYIEVPLGSIKPTGWLLSQLETMRDGATGQLDEIHQKIKEYNGWLGFHGDGWEETPYWLDGAVPLAYLLEPVTDRTGVYKGRVEDEVKKITLVPYGFTKVRIVAFPVVK